MTAKELAEQTIEKMSLEYSATIGARPEHARQLARETLLAVCLASALKDGYTTVQILTMAQRLWREVQGGKK